MFLGEDPWQNRALEGCDLVLAIKVLDGPKGKTPKDGVHVFIDGRHDGSSSTAPTTFTSSSPANSRAVRRPSSGAQGTWFTKVAVAEIDGGYTMEIRWEAPTYRRWAVAPRWRQGVYGLDVAVDEGDDSGVSQQVWRGDANDAEDTSHFGTIVLTAQPAMASKQPEKK